MESESSKNCKPSDKLNNHLDSFFLNGLYNSCQEIDELLKNIEDSQDAALAKKALALYQLHYSSLDRPWNHVNFMYGLGILYMHFNAYNLAIKAFRGVLYVQPSFPRSRDVHTRLGLIFKASGRYRLSEKHFNLAINDRRPSSGISTDLELKFHLAHILQLMEKQKHAKEAYERLLQENNLPPQLSANINRQLGLLYFYNETDSISRENDRKKNAFNHQHALSKSRNDAALNYLTTSYQNDNDPTTSYYLGRCYTDMGKFQDAFDSYKRVLNREGTADSWCSIGVLYHRQNQPIDALQAFIRAVQYDKQHAVSWKNLGSIYESHGQFYDALKCYRHALRSNLSKVDRSLQERVKFIQKHLNDMEATLGNSSLLRIKSNKLISLEDLWNVESKNSFEESTSSSIESAYPSKISKVLSTTDPDVKFCPPPQANISTQPVKSEDSMDVDQQNNTFEHSSKILSSTNSGVEFVDRSYINQNLTYKKEAILDQPNDIQTNNNHKISNEEPKIVNSSCNNGSKPRSTYSKDFCLSQVLTNGTSKDSGISSNSSTYADCALVPSQNTDVNSVGSSPAGQVIEACKNSPKPRKIDVNFQNDEEQPPHLFPRPPPYPPIPSDRLFPSPYSVFLDAKKDLNSKSLLDLCQSNPISIIRNIASVLKLDLGLFSTKTLVESNADHQIEVSSHLFIPGGENVESIESKTWTCQRLLSSCTISRYAYYQVSSFRESLQQELEGKSNVGKTNSTKESETDSNESVKRLNSNSQSSNRSINQTTIHGTHSVSQNVSAKNSKSQDSGSANYVKSAEAIDLSDEKKWRPQLNELNKLPSFFKCVSAANMLTHAGANIPGLNTTSMSMHVPGCKILGNKTPNNFCLVNINVGPGDYEWYAVATEYGNAMNKLCNKNGVEFDERNWWPDLDDLKKHNIPVYRFLQRPGDLVWVNSGTIYWTKAAGWCNNIFWYIGPISTRQYKLAAEKIEVNKLIFTKSEVPMVQLTWNMVINIDVITDNDLYDAIIDVLRKSLRYCVLVKELVNESKQEVYISNGVTGPRLANFCSVCECEVFNISFINRQNDSILHCIECARRADSTFIQYQIKQEYDLDYLMKLYDGFIETKRKFQSYQKNRSQTSKEQPSV